MVSSVTKWIIAGISAAALGAAAFYVFNITPTNPLNILSQNQPAALNQLDSGPGLPKRLIIPSINVNAPVINVGLAADGSVGVPKGAAEVAWYQLGPRPGQFGSSVVTGHYGPWRDGSHSVFDNLNELKIGDRVQVIDDKGTTFTFVVRQTKMYNANEAPEEVFNKTGGTYVNLITCQGEWLASQKTYTQRLVVFTELIN